MAGEKHYLELGGLSTVFSLIQGEYVGKEDGKSLTADPVTEVNSTATSDTFYRYVRHGSGLLEIRGITAIPKDADSVKITFPFPFKTQTVTVGEEPYEAGYTLLVSSLNNVGAVTTKTTAGFTFTIQFWGAAGVLDWYACGMENTSV